MKHSFFVLLALTASLAAAQPPAELKAFLNLSDAQLQRSMAAKLNMPPCNYGKCLRGMIHRPHPVLRRAPGVIFFHGFTGDRMESHWMFVKCARALAKAGVASLRFDFSGSGESEGEFRDATLHGEVSDARAAVDYFQSSQGINPERLGLVGLSLGGAIAAVVAPQAGAQALVLWAALAHPTHLRALAESYLHKFPDAAMTFSLGDFDLYRIEAQSARFVAGFGQIFNFGRLDFQVAAVAAQTEAITPQ